MTFEWPMLLWGLLLVPILLGLYVLAQRRRRRYTLRFTNLDLLAEVVGRGPGIRRHIPPLLYLLGLAVMLVSLARPQAVIAVPRDTTTVMLVIDVSRSMAATDLPPNRLAAAKQAAQAYLDAVPENKRVGLVSFSSSASLSAAATDDHASVSRAIDNLVMGQGTAIGDGLNLALDHLLQQAASTDGDTATDGAAAPGPDGESDEQGAPGLVVLLSDGQSTAGMPPDTAAVRAASLAVKVHTVGIGERGATPSVGRGQRVGLDEQTLQDMAATTGGEYFYAAETSELADIYSELGAQVSWVEERTEVTALVGALGTALLLLGCLLSLRWLQQIP